MKIRMVRELRGYSQEYVTSRLGIAQNTYSKIENNQSKLAADMLQKIAEVLEVSPADIMTQQPAIINFQSNTGTQHAIGHADTVITTPKELYEQLIAFKDAEIARLERIVENLLGKK